MCCSTPSEIPVSSFVLGQEKGVSECSSPVKGGLGLVLEGADCKRVYLSKKTIVRLRTSGISSSTSDFALRLNWSEPCIDMSPKPNKSLLIGSVTGSGPYVRHASCMGGWRCHLGVSPFAVRFHHFSPPEFGKKDLVLHKLRELFRRFFYKHVNGHRRDACHGTRYDADRCAWVRNRARKELCAFQVLTATTVSPAAFEK